MFAIGVDIGGTTTRVGVVKRGGMLLAMETFPTPTGFASLREAIGRAAAKVLGQPCLHGDRLIPAGIAAPGVMDEMTGRTRRSLHLPFLESRNPLDLLPLSLQQGAVLLSDATAAAWGEFSVCKGAARRFAHLRLGTGVACGVIIDGKAIELKRSPNRHADVVQVRHGPGSEALCDCGGRGCLEAIASRPALCVSARKKKLGDSLTELAKHVAEGKPDATGILGGVERAVAVVVKQLAGEYGVDLVVLGGGVLAELPCIMQGVQRRLGREDSPRVEAGLLGDGAGVVGAGMLAVP